MLLLLLFLILVNSSPFVRRDGHQLILDNAPFRFAGANMYWLGLDENVDGVNYPTQFRVQDAFQTAVEMGATVVRAHTLGISTGNSLSFESALNVFNTQALDYIDFAVYTAGQYGIKLVVPLTDNYHYYHGGKHDFTDWRGISDENQFYSNTQVIADFKNYISKLLTHVNKYNGLRYCDDPTVLAWETGNEISPPTNWTKEIADYIKSVDPNHLVLDGTYGINTGALGFSSVDCYSDHYYPMNTAKLTNDANLVANASKVFIAGEFEWTSGILSSFLSTLESLPVGADMFWSFFPHLDTYGYVQHNDGLTLHYPGDTTSMSSNAQLLRNHAFAVLGKSPPPSILPPAPLITTLKSGQIAWRGSAAAGNYSVEKATSSSGPWTVICTECANDNQTPWNNNQITTGAYYRVHPYNIQKDAGTYSPTQYLSSFNEEMKIEQEETKNIKNEWYQVSRPVTHFH